MLVVGTVGVGVSIGVSIGVVVVAVARAAVVDALVVLVEAGRAEDVVEVDRCFFDVLNMGVVAVVAVVVTAAAVVAAAAVATVMVSVDN